MDIEKQINDKYTNAIKDITNFVKEKLVGKYFCINRGYQWNNKKEVKAYGLITDAKFYTSSESMTCSVYNMILIKYKRKVKKDTYVDRELRYTIEFWHYNNDKGIILFDDENSMKLYQELNKEE